MALNGWIETTHFSDSTVKETWMVFNWWATQDYVKNESYVNWEVRAKRNSTSWVKFSETHIEVNGGRYDRSGNFYNDTLISSGSFTVKHDDAGYGSFSMKIYSYVYYNAGGYIYAAADAVELDRIPRYTTVYNSERGKTSSSISVNWSTTDPRDWTRYSLNGGEWKDAYDTVASDNKSGHYTISNLSPNTAYKVKTQCRRTDSQLWSESGEITITTYDTTRPSLTLSSKTSSSITVASSVNVATSSVQYRIKKSDGSYGSYQTGATFSNLAANTKYTIEVKAVGKDSGETGTATLDVTTYQKTIPTITLASKTSSSITVKANVNVSTSSIKYRIKKSGGSYGEYQASASFTGLSANTDYIVEVYAVGEASGESATATLNVKTYNKTIPTITLSSKTSTSITVTSGANVTVSSTQYRIKKGTGAYGNYQTSATFSGLSPNTAYTIEVKKVGTDSGESGTATLTVTTYQKTTATIALSSKTSTSITVSSTINVTTSEVKYRIKKSGGSYGSYQTGASFTGLTPNTSYIVEVYAVGKDSGESATATVTVTTYQQTIASISMSSKTSTSITVSSSVNVATSEVKYRIKQGSGAYGSYQTGTTFSSLSPNTAYTIEVKAVGKDSGEADTATVTVTTYQKTTVSIALANKSVNTIKVTPTVNVTTSSVQYRIKTSNGNYGSYQTSAEFKGLTPNTAYIIEIKATGKDSGESATSTLSVTTYQIATISSAPAFNLGDSVKITLTNPSGNAIAIGLFTEDIQTTLRAYQTITGTSYTFTFTDAELDAIYKLLSTQGKVNVKIYLRTTNDGSTYYNNKTVAVTLTGNQKTGHVNINDSYKRTKRWINVNGTWKRAVRWINVNGTWKRCI